MTNNQRILKKWYKSTHRGFLQEEEIPDNIMASIRHELSINSGFIGVYVYHVHILEKEHLTFKGMELGYYVRSKNPFKWQYNRTYGNH